MVCVTVFNSQCLRRSSGAEASAPSSRGAVLCQRQFSRIEPSVALSCQSGRQRTASARRLVVSRASALEYEDDSFEEYGEDLEPIDADYDLDDSLEKADRREAVEKLLAQRELMEQYGLEVGSLCATNEELDALIEGEDDEQDWDEAFLKDDDGMSSSFEDDDSDDDEPENLYEDEDVEVAQMAFHADRRRSFEMSRVQEVAFELHHHHAETTHNIFANTNAFGMMLQKISESDDVIGPNTTSSIPLWVRAQFVMEEVFEDLNHDLLLATRSQSVLGDGDHADEDEGAYEDDEAEQDAGEVTLGDTLDSLFVDVLPGVASTKKASESEDYAEEMLSATKLRKDGEAGAATDIPDELDF